LLQGEPNQEAEPKQQQGGEYSQRYSPPFLWGVMRDERRLAICWRWVCRALFAT
jgi:hypothetical protein